MAWFELISPFSPEECVDRLQDGMTPDNRLDVRTAYQWVQLSKRPHHRNSFRPFLHAHLTAHGTGSLVRGRLGFHPFVIAFMAVWVGFCALGSVLAAVHGTQFPQVLAPFAPGLILPVTVRVFRLFWCNEDRLLMNFVTKTLDAKVRWRWP